MPDYYAQHLAILRLCRTQLTAAGGLTVTSERQLNTTIETFRTAYTGPVIPGNPGSQTLVAMLSAKTALGNAKAFCVEAAQQLSRYILLMEDI